MKEDNLCERTVTHVNLEESYSFELSGLNSSVSSLNCENKKDLKCHCFNVRLKFLFYFTLFYVILLCFLSIFMLYFIYLFNSRDICEILRIPYDPLY